MIKVFKNMQDFWICVMKGSLVKNMFGSSIYPIMESTSSHYHCYPNISSMVSSDSEYSSFASE
jgi:hypothetical protein